MNNFRKRIGHLLCLCFTLAILVTCFMASGITASADRYAPNCSLHDWSVMELGSCDVDFRGATGRGFYHDHRYWCPESGCWESASKRVLMPTDDNCLEGDSSGGGGSHVPSHTHNYSTTWGAWRKISSCRLPG